MEEQVKVLKIKLLRKQTETEDSMSIDNNVEETIDYEDPVTVGERVVKGGTIEYEDSVTVDETIEYIEIAEDTLKLLLDETEVEENVLKLVLDETKTEELSEEVVVVEAVEEPVEEPTVLPPKFIKPPPPYRVTRQKKFFVDPNAKQSLSCVPIPPPFCCMHTRCKRGLLNITAWTNPSLALKIRVDYF